MQIQIQIPGNPVGKARPRVCGGHAFTPEKTASYESLVQWTFVRENPAHKIFTGPVAVGITAYYPIPQKTSKKERLRLEQENVPCLKKPDVDNVAKIILDALNTIAYKDDAQIYDLHVRKFYSANPRVVVRLTEIAEE